MIELSGAEGVKICFVISPIGSEGSETRRRADQVFNHVIEPAVSQCGYHAIRADQISNPGVVTSQIIHHLIEDPLVVADLAEPNPNVFYELAIRHSARKPIVQITQSGGSVPFDVAQTRVIQLDLKDPDSVAVCRQNLVRQIQSAEKDPDIDNPISTAVDLQLIRGSGNPIERTLALVVSMLTDLKLTLEESSLPRIAPSRKTDGKSHGFIMALPDPTYAELARRATEIGLTIEEMIRTVIVPEWTAEVKLQSNIRREKAVVDQQLELLKGFGDSHIFSANLADGAAGEPGFVIVSDRTGKTTFFDVYLKGGYVSGSSEEVVSTLEQVVEGIQTKMEELKMWMNNPDVDKSVSNR